MSLTTVNWGALERRGTKNHQRAAPVSPAVSPAASRTRVSGQTLMKTPRELYCYPSKSFIFARILERFAAFA